MKINVVFDFPGIDPDSEEADNIISCLEIDLRNLAKDDLSYMWYIDDAIEDDKPV